MSKLRQCLSTTVVCLRAKMLSLLLYKIAIHVSIIFDVAYVNLLGTMDDDCACTAAPDPRLFLLILSLPIPPVLKSLYRDRMFVGHVWNAAAVL